MNKSLFILFRLACFVLPSYFLFSSAYNGDIKGLVYIAGYICSIFGANIVLNNFTSGHSELPKDALCNLFTINGISNTRLPLSTSVLSFTVTYLIYCMFRFETIYDFESSLILLFFVSAIFSDILFNMYYGCINIINHSICILGFAILGLIVPYIVELIGIPNALFYDFPSNSKKCSKKTDVKYRCAPFHKGKQVALHTS